MKWTKEMIVSQVLPRTSYGATYRVARRHQSDHHRHPRRQQRLRRRQQPRRTDPGGRGLLGPIIIRMMAGLDNRVVIRKNLNIDHISPIVITRHGRRRRQRWGLRRGLDIDGPHRNETTCPISATPAMTPSASFAGRSLSSKDG